MPPEQSNDLPRNIRHPWTNIVEQNSETQEELQNISNHDILNEGTTTTVTQECH